MKADLLAELANHLWQSSLVAGVVGLLLQMLRNNHARTRHWIWLAVSCKFLVPFSLLTVVGNSVRWRPTPEAVPAMFSFVVVETSEPFTATASTLHGAADSSTANLVPSLCIALWACGLAGMMGSWWMQWRRIRAVVQAGTDIPMKLPVRTVTSSVKIEPGVFGILRPVLILPGDILDRLTPAQLDAILAHELCHLRYRDNLSAAIQMFVECVFWFYPPVWWIGGRMVAERERACDEEVLQLGKEPRVYAEGILQICKCFLEAPKACVSGVMGANLKQRIEGIMRNQTKQELSTGRKLLLAVAAAVGVVSPVVVGMTGLSPVLRAQSQAAFEAASVKPHPPGSQMFGLPRFLPGGLTTAGGGVPVQILISAAYNLPFQSGQLTGGPDWIRDGDHLYDIEAKADPRSLAGLSQQDRESKLREMLQALLAERFKLIIRREMREQPVYTLTVAKNGPKLKSSRFEEKDCEEAASHCHEGGAGQGRGIHVKGFTMAELVVSVSNFTDRPLVDRTGLKGLYDIDTEGWVPMRQRPVTGGAPSSESIAMNDPSRRTLYMIFETLGLKMESSRAPVEMFVIEHVEKPSEN